MENEKPECDNNATYFSFVKFCAFCVFVVRYDSLFCRPDKSGCKQNPSKTRQDLEIKK